MNPKQLAALGITTGLVLKTAIQGLRSASKAGMSGESIEETIRKVIADPHDYLQDPNFGSLAEQLKHQSDRAQQQSVRDTPLPYRTWGSDIDPESFAQMDRACRLPISVAGALMPDAHVGYGLPIGGVLATRNAVIPYAVGVDIACRMKISVIDLSPATLTRDPDRLIRALERETRFGVGATFKKRREHDVMDADWSVSPVTKTHKDKAWAQLGTSGSGNHFVEFGELHIDTNDLGLEPGTYLALLSHSGSRGTGSSVADHYSRLAKTLHPKLPKEMVHLAWLDFDTVEGEEYWEAMQLMGRYAAANHACIHRHIVAALGAEVLLDIENHHNFAWKEEVNGETLIVHRKGATPAGKNVLGIIPGSMASPAFIIRGKGHPESLNSASHGAGRMMSRKKAIELFTWKQLKTLLDERGVTLLTAGLDEAPMAYKPIEAVMAAQTDLVEPLAQFHPRLVKMAAPGERPED